MKNRGFSLISFDVIVSLTLLVMIIGLTIVYVSGNEALISRTKNEIYINQINDIFKKYYDSNAYEIELTSDNVIKTRDVFIKSGSYSYNITDSLKNIGKNSNLKSFNFKDGYNTSFNILVSERLEKRYDGIDIPYRIIAFVSSNGRVVGKNTKIKTKIISSTGEVIIDPSEMVSILDTSIIQINKYNESKKIVKKIANAYSLFFWSSYNNTFKNKDINFFYSNSIKKSSQYNPISIDGYSAPGIDAILLNMDNSLNLNKNLFKDAWGNNIFISNSGRIYNVKTGDSVYTITARDKNENNKNLLPFSSYVGFLMSNGNSYNEIVISNM